MSISLENIQEYNTALQTRFADKLKVNRQLNRQLVSFQANKNKPFYRWFKYKEGFSEALVQHLLDHLRLDAGRLLDPFSGAGTTLFVASERGLDATGIELLPLGCEIVEVCKLTKNADVVSLRSTIHRWQSEQPWKYIQPTASFPHIRITKGAFAEDAQQALNRYLTALKSENPSVARVLRFAAMSILEEISYTRKDGQYLRWDYRSERKQGKRPFDKGKISNFDDAIIRKLNEISNDLQPTGFTSGLFSGSEQRGEIVVLQGSSLNTLPTLASKSFDRNYY